MIIYCDIDGTICTQEKDYNKALPIYKNIAKINKLYNEGHTIVYWTARGKKTSIDWSELTIKQLNDWNCLYHKISFDKPAYDVLYDDKAFKIEDISEYHDSTTVKLLKFYYKNDI
jgi:hypothetical protein